MVFEAGLTMMSACWGWIREELFPEARVVTYDRSGLGWSEEREGIRDGRTIARELRELLRAAEVRPPYILGGHSMGAIYNLAFLKLFPAEVAACVWFDPSHPRQRERSRTIRRKMRNFFLHLEAAHLLASKNLPRLSLPLREQIAGLPEADFIAAEYFFRNSRHLRTSAREARAWGATAEYAGEVRLEERPLLILSARKNAMRGWADLQRELAGLSKNSRQVIFSDASHMSLLGQRRHAQRAASEILEFLTARKL